MGIFQFRVCSLDETPNKDATHACLDANLLQVAPGTTDFAIKASYTTVRINVSLPQNLTCKHCVFQWKYRTGNSWGSYNGKSCLGCGRENEEFYGCSDISIIRKDKSITEPPPPPTTTAAAAAKKEVTPATRTCGSAITFRSTFDLFNIMDQYCKDVCPNNCAQDNKPGNEILYNGCVNSCNKLCSCQ